MIFYKKTIKNGWVVQNTEARHAEALEALQRRVFPTLSDAEILTAAHYRRHLEVFPEGQFTVLDAGRVIGMSTTMRYHFSEENHTFLEVSDHLWIAGTHEPQGEWLYGLDVGVDPDYRGQGIARELYQARHEVVRQLGLKGQLTVGMLNGYVDWHTELSIDEYFEKVRTGELTDPTVSAQQRIGFKIIRLIKDYLDDPTCGNAGALMSYE